MSVKLLSSSEQARILRCLFAWLDDRPRCECDFPDEEIGESGIIFCEPCSLRDTLDIEPCEQHAKRFGRARGEAQR